MCALGTHSSFPFQGPQGRKASRAPLREQCLPLYPSSSPLRNMGHFSKVLQHVLSCSSHSPAKYNHFCSLNVSQDFSPLQPCLYNLCLNCVAFDSTSEFMYNLSLSLNLKCYFVREVFSIFQIGIDPSPKELFVLR